MYLQLCCRATAGRLKWPHVYRWVSGPKNGRVVPSERKTNVQPEDSLESKIENVPLDRLITSARPWPATADVMSKNVITICPGDTVLSAAKAMSENGVSCIVVVDNGSVVGILTERDFLNIVAGKRTDLGRTTVAEVMSSPVQITSPKQSVFDAGRRMEDNRIKRLPVLDGNRLVGIVTQTDMVQVMTTYGLWREVADIMSRNVVVVQATDTAEHAAKLMSSRRISSLVVLEDSRPAGILTERDLLKRVVARQEDPARVSIAEVMSSPVISIAAGCSVFSASKMMADMKVRRLVVLQAERVCGIVAQTDIFRAAKEKLQKEEDDNLELLEQSESAVYTTDLNGNTTPRGVYR